MAKNEKTQLIEALFNNKINNDLKNFLKILVTYLLDNKNKLTIKKVKNN